MLKMKRLTTTSSQYAYGRTAVRLLKYWSTPMGALQYCIDVLTALIRSVCFFVNHTSCNASRKHQTPDAQDQGLLA